MELFMILLKDGSRVEQRIYSYLVEFNNENNGELMLALTGKTKLKELSQNEFYYLFKTVAQRDLELIPF